MASEVFSRCERFAHIRILARIVEASGVLFRGGIGMLRRDEPRQGKVRQSASHSIRDRADVGEFLGSAPDLTLA